MGYYNGFKKSDLGYSIEYFTSDTMPTEESHGDKYFAVMGPFRTKRGAKFHEAHGLGNPHIQTTDDADRIAKEYAERQRA